MNKRILLILLLLSMALIIGCSVNTNEPADNTTRQKAIKMLEEAKVYSNYQPTTSYKYYVRANEKDTVGVKFDKSVAYSYGNKDTYDHFKAKIDKSWWANSWKDYQDFKVGLFDAETDWYSFDYAPTKWAGIDCSGLVQRAAFEAGFRFNDLPYKGDIGSGECNKFGGELSAQGLTQYFNSRVTDSNSFTITWVSSGDVVFYPDAFSAYHVAVVSKVDKVKNEVMVISALGPYEFQRVVETDIGLGYRNPPAFEVRRWTY